MKRDTDFLGLFLGPKAENANYLEELFLLILRDYFHWRRNYFPSDHILITRTLQREMEAVYDKTYQNIIEMTAELRRNFPFYSSRYIAHMLSDTLIPSIAGYLAGMLYNPNNVTPEAAPVTVDMEIDACNVIVQMLGYTPAPDIPTEFTQKTIETYKRKLEKEFAWAHLTMGGTTANLEALWVARAVKYTPLAIWDVAKRENLEIVAKMPDGRPQNVQKLSEWQILNIKPNESIYLLARYVDAVRNKYKISIAEAGSKSEKLLQQSEYSLGKGVGNVFSKFPPVILVSGTAHYSIKKAANILGIGEENIELIHPDSQYRLDVNHLQQVLRRALDQRRIPLAVIAIAGTTEEGAVDPIHKIQDLRDQFEKEQNISFWLHVDAAWGGYIRSVFNLSPHDQLLATLNKISAMLHLKQSNSISDWENKFFAYMEKRLTTPKNGNQNQYDAEQIQKDMADTRSNLTKSVGTEDWTTYTDTITRFISRNARFVNLPNTKIRLTLDDRINLVNNFVSDDINIKWRKYSRNILIKWGAKDVISSFLALPKANSITIDPHKMGYVNYPAGMIAFKNDRVRHFILQKAPYITSVRQDVLVHMPPRHIDEFDTNPKRITEAFAPFIVEGSRPGAAAAAIWATVKTIPPTMRNAGSVVRSSLLAARELYEWLVHWDTIMKFNREDTDFQFIPLTMAPPDTNVVIFTVKKKTNNTLQKMNELTKQVYERFSIQSELGEREYSYAQPFFLSKTEFQEPNYSYHTIKPIFERHFNKRFLEKLSREYKSHGIIVLRATVMNPYIAITRQLSDQNVLKEFMQELYTAAVQSVKSLQ